MAAFALAALAASSASLRGDVIVSAAYSGGAAGVSLSPGAQEASWTQTGTYSNVVITALINGYYPQPTTAFAQLMNAIGPGATLGNQIASATVPVPLYPDFSYASTTLFSGLTLGPGTYYLVVSQSWAWDESQYATVVTGAGVSNLSHGFVNTAQAFAPSSTFTSDAYPLLFSVSGDNVAATPEPATQLMLGVAILGLMMWRRRAAL